MVRDEISYEKGREFEKVENFIFLGSFIVNQDVILLVSERRAFDVKFVNEILREIQDFQNL